MSSDGEQLLDDMRAREASSTPVTLKQRSYGLLDGGNITGITLVKNTQAELTIPCGIDHRDELWMGFLSMIGSLSGVTLLTSQRFDFPGGGLTGVAIIGESHAAIHTWPEKGKLYICLCSCGGFLALDEFAEAARQAQKHGGFKCIPPKHSSSPTP